MIAPLHQWKPWKVALLGLLIGTTWVVLTFVLGFQLAKLPATPQTIIVRFETPLIIHAPAQPTR